MTAPAQVSRLEDFYHQIANSFVRYVVECSQAELRDDFDRRVMSLYENWVRESRQNEMALCDLLQEQGVVPVGSSFPIGFAQFNFLSPSYLLSPVLEKGGAELAALGAIQKQIDAWPVGADLASAILKRQGELLEKARTLAAERPEEPPAPPRIKGTSASRW
jgi:hypothetical protein